MTDAERAAAAWDYLTKTTSSYPSWRRHGFPANSNWGRAKAELDQIIGGVVVPPPAGALRDKPPGWPDYAGFERVAMAGRNQLTLDNAKDYLVTIGDYVGPSGPQITGGRNVVCIGGRITLTGSPNNFGIALRPAGGHHYLEGVRIRPASGDSLNDGVVLRGSSGKYTIANVRVGPTSMKIGGDPGTHSDSLQVQTTFDGELRVDRVTSFVDYSGVMASNWFVRVMDFNRWNFVGYDVNPSYTQSSGAALYVGNTANVVRLNEFYWTPAPGASFAGDFFPTALASQAKQGQPSGGDFSPEQDWLNYTSPGYL